MYYFKDHLNFSNNLQDNLYILRQRQLKEAAWSPSSGGPAVPESAAGTNELKDRMRNIKQSGDRPQSKDYLEMEAEVKRREGQGSAPAASSDPSFKPAPQSSASDWRANYDNTRAVVTKDGRTEQMDKFEGQRGNVGGSRVNLDKPAASDSVRERTTVEGTPGKERLVGTVETKNGRTWIDPRDRPNAEEMAKNAQEAGMAVAAYDVTMFGDGKTVKAKQPSAAGGGTVPSTPTPANTGSPTTYRGFDRGDGLPQTQATPPSTPQRDMNISGQGSIPNNSGGLQNANQTPVTGTTAIPAAPQSSPSNAVNPTMDFLRQSWKGAVSPRYSLKPESASPGVDATEPQSFGTSYTDMTSGKPYVVPGSQDWNNMSHDEQEKMVSRAIFNNETNKFTGGRRSDVKDIDQVSQPRFSEDSAEGGPSAADINQRSRIANAVIDKANKEAQDQASNKFNKSAGVAENDPNYIYSRKGFAQSLYSPEEPKPAEDTRPTSGRQSIYPGAFQNIIDRIQNKDGSKRIFTDRQRIKFNRKAR